MLKVNPANIRSYLGQEQINEKVINEVLQKFTAKSTVVRPFNVPGYYTA
jgi:Mg2+ and Co2+ transporter CorA